MSDDSSRHSSISFATDTCPRTPPITTMVGSSQRSEVDTDPCQLLFPTNLSWSTFQDYKLIHEGIHNHIYKCKCPTKQVSVVIKVLAGTSTRNIVAVKDFATEMHILTRIQHENIIQIFGSGFTAFSDSNHSRPFVVVEYMDKNTLASYLAIKRSIHCYPFTELRYLKMAREFVAALDYLHNKFHPECAVIHRDLKPDNIGFDSNGTLKLMDFGLATYIIRPQALSDTYKLTGK